MVYSKRRYWVFDNGKGGAVFIAALLKSIYMTEKGTFHLQLSDTDRETLQQALQQLHHFSELYSAEDMQQRCWELLSCAFGSEEADTWTNFDRSNMLLFYKEWAKLGGMLFAVEKSFGSIKL